MTSLGREAEDSILTSLLYARSIGLHEEEVLHATFSDEPFRLLAFFHLRLDDQESAEDDRFEAIPFKFRRLTEVFANIGPQSVAVTRREFEPNDRLFEFRHGALLARLYPEFVQLAVPLMSLVQRGDEADIEFVLAVLRAYQGQAFLLPVCREIVSHLESESPLLKQVAFVLEQSGVVSGEFGFVDLNQQKRAEIEPWLTDESERVRTFAIERIQSLELAISAEKRRASERLELGKRTYGE
jgi:hypothetical protein